jgi:hypothetical protein
MNDKELLENAAKAAGITWTRAYKDGEMQIMLPFTRNWNPLTDDGDALRLAVKLNLVVDTYSLCVYYHSNDLEIEEHYPQGVIYDKVEATRRAIVRAAAEIGKQR